MSLAFNTTGVILVYIWFYKPLFFTSSELWEKIKQRPKKIFGIVYNESIFKTFSKLKYYPFLTS